ncbi:hypothetical protein FRACYDRAFT_248122 [Fragilariopsis cylindrus CCMP1102]|uniref:Uncharacterized protein n=1 Tax=Fragilariopsis cylindrus CCMP1102 TaxID=635003 RepID=A0A1E7EWG2_9STRA|nr:hypothetical protein FRACYDRAFT_248122 [Fragilariopsis cylindrus CCMP1102]|eukprot:OEU09873.1 hypothetical protein FRACYDRAFT_248122 [Fragilariopsis cylindrus CCMP1102]
MSSSSSAAISTQQQFFMVSFLFVSIAAVAFAAAAASSSLELLTLREFGLMLIGAVLSSIQQQQDKNCGGGSGDDEKKEDENNDKNIIRSVKELREIMPAGGNGSNLNDSKKVIGYLDDQMIEFISKSPFLQLATCDSETGTPFVSPKGDQPGFVTVVTIKKDEIDGILKGISLIIPDRPGNRLMLGVQNILNGSKNVSIIFEIPGMCTTLRCGGSNARISTDATLLRNHTARNCTPKVVLLIDIEYAFFHCAKAYMRSFGRYYAPKDSFLANVIDNDITDHYKGVQDAINGEGKEIER